MLYQYKARDKEGKLHVGSLEAAKKEAVADRLAGMGLIPVLIDESEKPDAFQFDWLKKFRKVPPQELIIFNRQLATLINAGVPFVKSLTTMERQTQNEQLKEAIAGTRRELEAGSTFSDALAKYPSIFSKLYVNMIRAAETGGILDEILNRLAILAEHEAAIRARVKAAIRYPLMVIISICVAFVVLVTVVVPKFSSIFAKFKTELPFPTKVLIGINYGIQHYWYLMLFGIVVLVWGTAWYLRTTHGRWHWDGLKLKLPIVGVLFQKVALSRFARVFSAMQKSGLSMMLTLEIAGEVTGNVVITRVVEEMRNSLREGKGLTEPMESSGMFPPLIVQMVSVGEETGDIDAMLNKVADYYDMDVEYLLKNLSTMLEPLLMLFVGGLVLFLALGIFLPMWSMTSLFNK